MWFRLAVLIPFLLGMLALACGYPGYVGYEAATAERTSAVVQRCERKARGGSTCYGSWTLPDGRRGAGKVEGASADQKGSRIDVWATPRSAATSRWGWWLLSGIFAIGWIIGLVVVGFAIRHTITAGKEPGPAASRWKPPRAFDKRDGRALYDAPVVVLDGEPRGLTGEVRYQLTDPAGALLARTSEPDLRVWQRVSRFMDRRPGDQRHRVLLLDAAGQPLLVLNKPRSGANPLRHGSVAVFWPDGTTVGSVDHANSNPLRPRFHLVDADGRAVAELRRPSGWSLGYVVTSGSAEVARVIHNASDRTTVEADYDNPDKLTLELRHRPTEPLHSLLLAAPAAVQLLTATR